MEVFREILNVAAAIATVAGFLLETWREYKQCRMTKGEKEKAGGNRPFPNQLNLRRPSQAHNLRASPAP